MRVLFAFVALCFALVGALAQDIGFSPPTSSPQSLPPGAMGFWLGSDFTTANGVATIPNRMAATPSNQLIPAPRRQFKNSYYYWTSGTVTENDSSDCNGVPNEATSIVTAASQTWYIQIGSLNTPVAYILPAGTYSVSVCARWKGTVGSQTFLHGCASSQAGVPSFTATDTLPHRYVQTLVSNGSTALFCYVIGSPVGGTQANFEASDFEIFVGSSDLSATSPLAGHMIFGDGLGQSSVTHDATSVSFAGALGAVAQFPTYQAFNALTAVYITKNTGTPTSPTFNPLLSRLNSGTWVSFGVGAALNGLWGLQWNNALKTPNQGPGYGIENQSNYQDVAISYDLATSKTYVNGTFVISNTASGIVQNINEFWVGMLQRTFFSNYQLAALAIWPRALSDAEITQAHNYLLQTVPVPRPDDSCWVGFDGDSITNGAQITNNAGFGYQSYLSLNKVCHGPNLSIPGQTCTQILARISVDLANISLAKAAGRSVIWHTLCGTNDAISGQNPTTVTAPTIESEATQLIAAGAKVVVATMLPSTTTNVTADRAIVNPLLRAAAAGIGFTIDDFAGNPIIGPDAAALTALFNADHIHPTGPVTDITSGTFILVPLVAAAINALL